MSDWVEYLKDPAKNADDKNKAIKKSCQLTNRDKYRSA